MRREQIRQLPQHWRIPLLILWFLLAGALLTTYLVDLPLTYRLIAEPCAGDSCHYQAITQAEADVLRGMGLSTAFYAAFVTGTTILTVLVFASLAALILYRRSHDQMGLVASFTLLTMPTVMITNFDVVIETYPAWEIPILSLYGLGNTFFFIFILIFPTGRLQPRWSILILAAALLGNVLEIGTFGEPTIRTLVAFVTVTLSTLATVIYRYRRLFTPTERQQSKWALYGILSLFMGVFVWLLTYEWLDTSPGGSRLLLFMGGWILCQFTAILLPSGLAISILRHQLWDIDLIIRRTAVYGLLTSLLALVYFGSVLVLQRTFSLFSAGQSPLSIVVSTLLIAALFNPVRTRVQRFIDRRFYRARYDARRTLAQFAAAARDEVNLEQLTAALTVVIGRTMQPTRINLWLKETADE